MKINCNQCGELVVEGEMVMRKTRRGEKRKFDLNYSPRGIMIKNSSNDPKKWKGICSKCQKKNSKSK